VGADVPATAIAAVERALLKDRGHRTPDVATFVKEFTGEAITLTPSAGAPPAPQLAVVATPSMVMSASLAMGDTAAPGSQPGTRAPTPAPVPPIPQTATQLPPPSISTPNPPPSSAVARPTPGTTSSSSTSRFRAVWVTAALLVAVGVGYTVSSQKMEPDRLASDDTTRNQPVTAVNPSGPPPPPPEPVKPVEPEKLPEPVAVVTPQPEKLLPLQQESPRKPPPATEPKVQIPPPAPPPSSDTEARGRMSLEDKLKVQDLARAAQSQGLRQANLSDLVRFYNQSSEGVENQHTLDEMAAIVAEAMCAQHDLHWKDYARKIKGKRVHNKVERNCQ
jgi:hypothetical protein